MLTALETGRDVAITGEDGRRTIELITAVYKVGSAHMPGTLPIQPEAPFYTVAGIRASVPHVYEMSASVAELTGDITFGSDLKIISQQRTGRAFSVPAGQGRPCFAVPSGRTGRPFRKGERIVSKW